MRTHRRLMIALAAVLLLTAAAFAADAPKETLEATATRVRELEKANVVLQEDLARARLQLDLTRESLGKARADLDAEVAARKALEARLAESRQQTTREIANSGEALTRSLTDSMQPRIAELEKALQALTARQQADVAALKQQHEAQVASLQQALSTEKAERQASEKSASEQIAKLEKGQKRDRTLGWALNGVNLGISLMKR